MAILEIPELEAQLQEDQGDVKNASDEVSRAQHMLKRYQAMYKALDLEYTRLNGVFESKPGLVARQEVDDAQGKDLAAASQVDAGQAALEAAQSKLAASQSKLAHDQALFDYARITAPFAGVVTERYANLGTLMQARHQLQHSSHAAGPAFPGRSVPSGHSGSGIRRALHPRWRSGGRSGARA